jgi:hypothetical protein
MWILCGALMTHSVLAGFPESLTAVAFVNGEEAAWEQKDCHAAIDWLSQNNHAVLGFDLWVVRNGRISTALSTKSGPAIYVYSCDLLEGETWNDYVRALRKRLEISSPPFVGPKTRSSQNVPCISIFHGLVGSGSTQTLGTSSLTIRFA